MNDEVESDDNGSQIDEVLALLAAARAGSRQGAGSMRDLIDEGRS